MIVHSDDYVEYCRETAIRSRHLHDLALRGRGKEEVTRLVHERIVREVELAAGDDLVDIGCGDGTLLRMATELGVRSALGLHATEQEAKLVRGLGFSVKQGLSHNLPVADASASVVVCNNVLLVVPRANIPNTLREICRIAKPGGRVFLGEVPFVPGSAPEPQFAEVRNTLSYLYHKHGLRTWFGMLRRMAYSKVTGRPMIIHNGKKVAFYAQPEEFLAMTQAAGLRLVRYWRHEYIDTRNNYLFHKPTVARRGQIPGVSRENVRSFSNSYADNPKHVPNADGGAGGEYRGHCSQTVENGPEFWNPLP
jgi:ubiquinone/menaquinone biosynthesis C-methylase UbiE